MDKNEQESVVANDHQKLLKGAFVDDRCAFKLTFVMTGSSVLVFPCDEEKLSKK